MKGKGVKGVEGSYVRLESRIMVLSKAKEASHSSSGELKNILSRGNSKYTGIEAGIASQVCPKESDAKEF